MRRNKNTVKQYGFTIVELLIVIVVIAILTAVTIVAYRNITSRATESTLQSDLKNAATQLNLAKVDSGTYPGTADTISKSPGTTYAYTGGGTSYCLSATSNKTEKSYYISSTSGGVKEGECPLDPSFLMQSVTNANCPTTRTMKVDARDNHTYWIQAINGKCWMLTNLSYAGGGDNTYNDVIPIGDGNNGTLSDGTADSTGTYTTSKYYAHTSANPTTSPIEPSVSTTGGSTGLQYGYLYNWCAAMGSQAQNMSCLNSASYTTDINTSICSKGWRLPTGDTDSEFTDLLSTVGNASNLRSAWLAQYSGRWYSGTFSQQGNSGRSYYWATSNSGSSIAPMLQITSNSTQLSTLVTNYGLSVRCVVAN